MTAWFNCTTGCSALVEAHAVGAAPWPSPYTLVGTAATPVAFVRTTFGTVRSARIERAELQQENNP